MERRSGHIDIHRKVASPEQAEESLEIGVGEDAAARPRTDVELDVLHADRGPEPVFDCRRGEPAAGPEMQRGLHQDPIASVQRDGFRGE